MTVTPHGYPDWQRQSSIADVWILSEAATVVASSATVTRGPTFVGTFPAVGVSAVITTGRFVLTFEFYRDEAFTVFLGQSQIRVNLDGVFVGAVPVFGPWMIVRITNEVAANSTISLSLWLQQHIGMRNEDPVDNQLVLVTPQNIAAATTLNFPAIRVFPGAASLSYRTTAVANSFLLQYLDGTGTFSTFWSRGNQLLLDPSIVFLPAALVRMQVINNDAAVRQVEAYLLADQHFMRG